MTKGQNFKHFNYKLTILDLKEIHYFKNAYCCYDYLGISKQSFHSILRGKKVKKIPYEFDLEKIHFKVGEGDGYNWDPDLTESQEMLLFDNEDDPPQYEVVLWELHNDDPDFLQEIYLNSMDLNT